MVAPNADALSGCFVQQYIEGRPSEASMLHIPPHDGLGPGGGIESSLTARLDSRRARAVFRASLSPNQYPGNQPVERRIVPAGMVLSPFHVERFECVLERQRSIRRRDVPVGNLRHILVQDIDRALQPFVLLPEFLDRGTHGNSPFRRIWRSRAGAPCVKHMIHF